MALLKRTIPIFAFVTVAASMAQPAFADGTTLPSALRPAASNPVNGFTQTVFSNSFDKQMRGPVQTGSGKNQFTLLAGTSNMTVENQYAISRPNALDVNVVTGQSAFVNKFFSGSYKALRIAFAFNVATDFSIAQGGYVGLESSETKAYTKTRTGRVELTLNPGGQLGITYYDTSYNTTHAHFYAWSAAGLIVPNHVYKVAIQQTFGRGGSIVVYLNGAQVIDIENINLGNLGTHLVDVGNLYASPDYTESGHLYFDNIKVATKPAK